MSESKQSAPNSFSDIIDRVERLEYIIGADHTSLKKASTLNSKPENPLYTMKLHETLIPTTKHGSIMILRVSGGWIYYNWDSSEVTGVFVPFDNEFMNFRGSNNND